VSERSRVKVGLLTLVWVESGVVESGVGSDIIFLISPHTHSFFWATEKLAHSGMIIGFKNESFPSGSSFERTERTYGLTQFNYLIRLLPHVTLTLEMSPSPSQFLSYVETPNCVLSPI